MQLTNELNGTATLIGDWTDKAMECLNIVGNHWQTITDGYGFYYLSFDRDFSEDNQTVDIDGNPDGMSGTALQYAFDDWEDFRNCKGVDPIIYNELLRLMAENSLSIFFYIFEESDYDGECYGEVGDFLLSSDGNKLSTKETSKEEFVKFMELRKKTGRSKIYESYTKSWEDEEEWEDEDEEDDDDLPEYPTEDITSLDFTGKTFVLTGDFQNCDENRDEIAALIEKKGGKCTGAVSGKTDFLVLGDFGEVGAKKVEQALEQQKNGKNIKIITESTLFMFL